jgi:hypothetical protein
VVGRPDDRAPGTGTPATRGSDRSSDQWTGLTWHLATHTTPRPEAHLPVRPDRLCRRRPRHRIRGCSRDAPGRHVHRRRRGGRRRTDLTGARRGVRAVRGTRKAARVLPGRLVLGPGRRPGPGLGTVRGRCLGSAGALPRLFVVATVTYLLRRGITESARWVAASSDSGDTGAGSASGQGASSIPSAAAALRQLMSGPPLRALVWTARSTSPGTSPQAREASSRRTSSGPCTPAGGRQRRPVRGRVDPLAAGHRVHLHATRRPRPRRTEADVGHRRRRQPASGRWPRSWCSSWRSARWWGSSACRTRRASRWSRSRTSAQGRPAGLGSPDAVPSPPGT